MKSALIIPILAAVIARAEDLPSQTMREQLHSRVMASLPIVGPAGPMPDPTPTVPTFLARLPDVSGPVGLGQDQKPNTGPVVVLSPFVVSELKRDRRLDAVIARQTEHQTFSPTSGGTLYGNGRLKVGGWWSPTEGWSFLKLSW